MVEGRRQPCPTEWASISCKYDMKAGRAREPQSGTEDGLGLSPQCLALQNDFQDVETRELRPASRVVVRDPKGWSHERLLGTVPI